MQKKRFDIQYYVAVQFNIHIKNIEKYRKHMHMEMHLNTFFVNICNKRQISRIKHFESDSSI
jgi:hypothetical protein